MKKTSLLLLVPVLIGMTAYAGIYRHDRKKSQYRALAAQPQFLCVGKLLRDDKFSGSCVLIGGRYVLSAAHCFVDYSTKPDTIREGNITIYANNVVKRDIIDITRCGVELNGRIYAAKRLAIYPGYLDSATGGDPDIAVVELAEEVKDVAAARLFSGAAELHRDVTGVGYGAYGPASRPDEVAEGPLKLAGENVVDSLGGAPLNGQATVLFCDFDHPTDSGCNKMGSARPRDLEYVCSGGDSGGGLFTQTADGWLLTGICHGSAINIQQMMKTGYYGQVMSWVRVAVFKDWITAQTRQ